MVTKVGDIQTLGTKVVFRYICWTNYKNCRLRACVSHICSIVLCSSIWKTIWVSLWGFTLSLIHLHILLLKIVARTEYHLWLYIMTGFLHPKSLIIISQRCNALWSLFLQSYHGVVSKCVSLGVHILRDGDNWPVSKLKAKIPIIKSDTREISSLVKITNLYCFLPTLRKVKTLL